MTIKFLFAISFLSLSVLFSQAQEANKGPKYIYYSAEGNLIPADKVDSVVKSYGGHFSMNKELFGDDSVVVHLVKIIPEMEKKMKQEIEARRESLEAKVGQPARDFSLSDMDGKKISLSSLKGKIVVLNFWFTACPPCIDEIPSLNEIVKTYENKNVVFLALTFNDKQNVKSFIAEHVFNYKILINSHSVNKDYGVYSYPLNLIIDQKGIIRFVSTFNFNMDEVLTKLIGEGMKK